MLILDHNTNTLVRAFIRESELLERGLLRAAVTKASNNPASVCLRGDGGLRDLILASL